MDTLVLAVTIIGVLGVGAQWLAWRFNLPAIVLMAIAGVIAGPVLGLFTAPGAAPGTPPMEALLDAILRGPDRGCGRRHSVRGRTNS